MSVTWSTAFFATSNSSGYEGSPTSPLVQALTFADIVIALRGNQSDQFRPDPGRSTTYREQGYTARKKSDFWKSARRLGIVRSRVERSLTVRSARAVFPCTWGC